MKQHILFIDDEPHVLDSFRRSLHSLADKWEMEFESCPLTAFDRVQQTSFDAIVTDVRMPKLSGMDLLTRLQSNPVTARIPVIIVTGEADKTMKRQALDQGAADLLNKPVQSDDLIARLSSVLRLKSAQDKLRSHSDQLERMVVQRTAQLEASRLEIIWRLARAAEFRDEDTGNHVIRVGCYSQMIAKQMDQPEDFIANLFLAAPLHDIGKIGIPDGVLLKPGKLNDKEWKIMQRHCEIGESILREDGRMRQLWERWNDMEASDSLVESPVIELAASIARNHHERWDGSGYPDRKSDESIPLAARIVAIADVFDALRSRRPYKEPMSLEKATSILHEGRGTHFDPAAHDAFFEIFDQIVELEQELADEDGSVSELVDITNAVC